MSSNNDIKKISKRIEETEEYLKFQKNLISENAEWWQNEVNKCIEKLQKIESRDYSMPGDEKKIKKLHDTLAYLGNKADMERKLCDKMDTIERRFHEDPYSFGVVKGGKQLCVGVGRILPHRNLLDIVKKPKKIKQKN